MIRLLTLNCTALLSDKVRYRFLHSLEISQGRKERTRNRTIVTQINMSLPSQIFIPHLAITKVTGKIYVFFPPRRYAAVKLVAKMHIRTKKQYKMIDGPYIAT